MQSSRMAESTMTQRAFDLCVRKTRTNIKQLADKPTTWSSAVDGCYENVKEEFFDIGNWTSSFFTGMALLAWRDTDDEFFLRQVERLGPLYRAKVFEHGEDTMHDLGFLYTLYSVALYKLTGDPAHREVGLRAAEVLARRFIPEGGYIRAWGRMDDRNSDYVGLAIVDCMMNLPLLYWAAKETGIARFHEIAVQHADTTMTLWIRPDDSVYHAYRFDGTTGRPLGPDNYCGRAVESQWARGTAWAIYGFALTYSYTRVQRHLDTAVRLARTFVGKLGEDIAPVWDFKLAGGEPRLVDSSAAAIATCGLQVLQKFCPHDTTLVAAKDQMLQGLCAKDFLDSNERVAGVLKFGQIGDGPGRARSAYTSWGDYYLMEALSRELHGFEGWW